MNDFFHGGIELNISPENNHLFSESIPGAYKRAQEDPADKDLRVTFFRSARLMGYQSNLMGYPVFENIDAVKIRYHKNGVFEEHVAMIPEGHRLRLWYTTRFPKHWEAYQRTHGEGATGTPLSMAVEDPALLQTLKVAKITTVEQLAAVEGQLTSIPGVREAQAKAKQYIAQQAGIKIEAVDKAELAKELESAKAELEQLKAVMAEKEEDGSTEDSSSDSAKGRKSRSVRKA